MERDLKTGKDRRVPAIFDVPDELVGYDGAVTAVIREYASRSSSKNLVHLVSIARHLPPSAWVADAVPALRPGARGPCRHQ